MENFQQDLLEYFINHDEKIILYDSRNSFEITLCLAAAKCFSPVLKESLETRIATSSRQAIEFESKSSEQQVVKSYKMRRVAVDGFNKETIGNFVKCIHGYGGTIELDWENMKELLKMSHFYQAEKLFITCQEIGKTLITVESVFEAIKLMETYEFYSWNEKCVELLLGKDNRDKLESEEWENALVSQPKTMSKLQSILISKVLPTKEMRECARTKNCLFYNSAQCAYSNGTHTAFIRAWLYGNQ